MPGNHALIYGASGISGWAVTNQLLNGYPTPDTFDRITALTNRPLSDDVKLWPKSDKLQVISGLDLMTDKGQSGLEEEMKSRIKDIDTVTHVFFFSYIFDPEPEKEIAVNVTLLERAVGAIENLSKNFKFVVFPTGTKAYGVHLIENYPFANDLPNHEGLPRIPEPYASQMFYYNQIDQLIKQSEGKPWSWCELRPDMIVGYVPNNNVYCLAQALSLYLSCYAAVEGKGAEVQFPGTEKSWKALCNDSSQDIIAKFAIWAALHPEQTSAEAFNIADHQTPSTWSAKWPIICEYFGLKGVGPPPGGSGPQPGDYVSQHIDQWKELEKKHGLKSGRVGNDRSFGGFPYFIMTMFNFDRQLSSEKTHKAWGADTVTTDSKGAWWTAFDRFREAKIIP